MRYVSVILIFLSCVKPGFESEHRPNLLGTSELLEAPQVTTVVVAPANRPKRQILHVLNWHFVDRKAFEADGGEDWETFLESVENVQAEQVDLLRHLKDVHGIDAVYLEGMTDADVEDYQKLAEALAGWKAPIGDDAMSEFLRRQHREDKLLLGAAAQVEGLEVLPVEDPEAMEAANPIRGAKVEYDEKAIELREDAMVKRLLTSNRTIMVLIMGGDHDLEENIKQLSDDVEYVRVVVRAHEEVIGD